MHTMFPNLFLSLLNIYILLTSFGKLSGYIQVILLNITTHVLMKPKNIK